MRNRIPTFLKIRKKKTDGGRNSKRKIATLRHDSHLFLPADQQAQTGSVSAMACVTCIGFQERKEEEEKNRCQGAAGSNEAASGSQQDFDWHTVNAIESCTRHVA
jgi:hypothetical protein